MSHVAYWWFQVNLHMVVKIQSTQVMMITGELHMVVKIQSTQVMMII
jgi:hypothetical protein